MVRLDPEVRIGVAGRVSRLHAKLLDVERQALGRAQHRAREFVDFGIHKRDPCVNPCAQTCCTAMRGMWMSVPREDGVLGAPLGMKARPSRSAPLVSTSRFT